MNLIIITPFSFGIENPSKYQLRVMVLCQRHAVENNHLVTDTQGMTSDPCFLCDKIWFTQFMESLGKQSWLKEISRHDCVYISGPMSNLPDYNRPAFHLMERIIKQTGCRVLSPARYPDKATELMSYQDHMRRDIKMVCESNIMIVMNGWEVSKGVEVELAVAKSIGISIFYEQN